MLEAFVGWLNNPVDRLVIFAGLFGAVFVTLAWRRTDTPENDTARPAAIVALREDGLRVRYNAMLTRALDAVDAKLSPEERADGAAPRVLATAWSVGLLNLSLSLACLYPIVGFLLNWGFFNNGVMGGEVFFPEAGWASRSEALWAIAVSILAGSISFYLQGVWKLAAQFVSISFAFAVSFALAIAVSVVVVGAVAVAVTLAVAAAFVFVGVLLLFSGGFGITGAAKFAPALVFALAAIVAVAAAGVLTGAGAWIGARFNRKAIAQSLWIFVCLILVSLAARNGAVADQSKGIILFIGVLPLINGLADFASTGLTRHLLRRSLRTSGRWEALLDLIGGAAIFAALGCAIIAFIAWTPLRDQTHLANLPQIFADLGDPALRGGYWWLLVMLASTLLPTALHLHLFLGTFIRHAPARLRHWLATEFEQAAETDSNTRGRDAVFMLSALNAFAIVLPLWVMTELWISVSPYAIDGSIAFFRAFAQTIGAIP